MKTKEKGITLIALVLTIVVLLILAGITITFVLGENGIINMAQKAAEQTNQAMQKEQENLENVTDKMQELINSSSGGNPEIPETPEIPKIPEGLEIGTVVSYNPSGTYNWLHKYCSSTKAEKEEDGTTDAYDLLESGTEKNFNISTWKVLSINETTGKVELVPSAPTTGTVDLGGAQGYNNGVKLLNDACSNLYGNSAKRITARSIKIEDIEKYMTEEAKTGTNGAHNYVNKTSNIKYGDRASNAYTSYKNYPVIYGKTNY